MQRKFIINLAFLVFLNLLIKPYWILGINVAVQNAVGPDVYGIYFAMMNFSMLFYILHDLGINNYNNRNVSRDPQFMQRHLSSMGLLKLLLGGIFLTATWTVGKYVMAYSDYYLFLLSLAGINLVLGSFLMFLRSNISGMQLFRLDSIASVMDRALMIVLCAGLLWGDWLEGPFQIEWFAYAQIVSLIVSLLYCSGVIAWHAKGLRWTFQAGLLPAILRQSFPFALLSLIMSVYNRVDGVMLESMLPDGNRQAGIYAQAYKFFEASNMIGYMVATLLLPMFSRMIGNREDVRPVVHIATRVLFLPALVLALSVALYAEPLMAYLYDREVAETAQVFPWLMATFVPVAVNYVYGTLLTANGSLRWLNLVALAGLVLNVLLNLWLIPRLQAQGSAFATLATQLLVVGCQVLLSVRLFKLNVQRGLMLRFLGFAGSLLVGIFLIRWWQGPWLLSLGGCILWGGGLTFLWRLVDVRQLLTLLKPSA